MSTVRNRVVIPYEECHRINENGEIEKLCNRCWDWFPCTDEYFYKTNIITKDCLFPYCKKCNIKFSVQWVKDNYDQFNESRRNGYFQTEKYKEWNKNHSKENRENGVMLNWQRKYPDKIKGYNVKHSAKKHKITTKEWEACKKYFIHRCAYCGLPIEEHWIKYRTVKLGDFHKEHVDDNGSIYLNNCVPSCKGCNSSKHEFKFDDWYLQQNFYSKERYDKIIKWTIEDYKLYFNEKKWGSYNRTK